MLTAFLVSAVFITLAELGDKTQIMTMTIAADPTGAVRSLGALRERPAGHVSPARGLWGVWLGSTAGMMLADGVAIVVGAMLGRKLPERLITRVSGTVFILFGLWALSAFIR
jgi:putative Ca2+/H+ antiporter (TMEM165/GDT1 family)